MANKRRSIKEINAGSMADIAFLLLIFFLVTTTMDIDSGIYRKLPPWQNEQDEEPPEIHKRNVYVVLINKENKILAGIGSPTKPIITDLDGSINYSFREDIKSFISNNGKNPNSSDSPKKAVISLQNGSLTKYGMYVIVQNELTKVYNELRNKKANADYGRNFNLLSSDEYKKIKDYYPMNISEADIAKQNNDIN